MITVNWEKEAEKGGKEIDKQRGFYGKKKKTIQDPPMRNSMEGEKPATGMSSEGRRRSHTR